MDIRFNSTDLAKSTDTLQVEMVRRASDGEIIEVRDWIVTQTEKKFILSALKFGKKLVKSFRVFIVAMVFICVSMRTVAIILCTEKDYFRKG